MRTEFSFIDITQMPQGPGAPAIVIPRVGGGVWHVPESPFDQPFQWVRTADGEYVRIPLFRYETEGREPPTAMAFAFELGARCVLQAPCRPKKLYLAVGVPVADLAAAGGQDALAFWFGVALQE